MILDEQALSDALHEIEVSVRGDLAHRARVGGRRRVMRRRAGIGAGVVAVGAAAVPVVDKVRGGGSARIEPTQQQHVYPGLLIAPPQGGLRECASGYSGTAKPADYSDILFLPAAQSVTDLRVSRNTWVCPVPHVALTAVQMSVDGDTFDQGIVIRGPNAPTAAQAGAVGPDQGFEGLTGHEPIDGQPAIEQTLPADNNTNVYWSEPDGGQWSAVVRDMPQDEAVDLLNRLVIDGKAGMARLPGAAKDGWTVEPAVPDLFSSEFGGMDAQWTDTEGHHVSVSVAQRPNIVIQEAVPYGGPFRLFTLRGGLASLTAVTRTLRYPTLTWQVEPDVEVLLTVDHGTEAEVVREASRLEMTSPDDPRFARN